LRPHRSSALGAGQHTALRSCNHREAKAPEPSILHGPPPAAVSVHGGSWVSGNDDTTRLNIDPYLDETSKVQAVVDLAARATC
jgi:acetyl esterase/lipase